MKKRIAFVVQRYGLEVNGGAELLCRQMAEHLADLYDIDIITTKAVDYLTWKDEYSADEEVINGIRVKRFGVKSKRIPRFFNYFSYLVEKVQHVAFLENKWIKIQGPNCPKMIDYIKEHKDDYDAFVFVTYLYYHTVKGLEIVADKSILVSTAHDEPQIYMDVFKKVFGDVKALYYLTGAEKDFVEKTFGVADKLNNNGEGGAGVDLPASVDASYLKREKRIENYIVYAGRIDEFKGCKAMIEYYNQYRQIHGDDVKLVLMGKASMELPKDDNIIYLGFVDDQVKFDVIAGAKALIMPSQFESLSIVVLEAMAQKVPVIVNGKCSVLKQHCEISKAGLWYEDGKGFVDCLERLMASEEYCRELGARGVEYINQRYTWDVVRDRMSALIEAVTK